MRQRALNGMDYFYRPYFHEVTVVRKIVTQSECNFFSLPSLRENSDVMTAVADMWNCVPLK